MKELFYFLVGIDVVYMTATAFLIQLFETFKILALNKSLNHAYRIAFCNILINSLKKKQCLQGGGKDENVSLS